MQGMLRQREIHFRVQQKPGPRGRQNARAQSGQQKRSTKRIKCRSDQWSTIDGSTQSWVDPRANK